MNVLLIGSGGREHALAWKISQSSLCEQLFILPGNAGTELIGKNIDVSVSDFEEIKNIVLNNNISMVVVGPEKPLVDGIYDFFISDSKLKNVTVIAVSYTHLTLPTN